MVRSPVTYALSLILILQLQGVHVEAQAVSDSLLLNSTLYKETLQLHTDRSLYAAGERLHFRLLNLSHPLLIENGWSTAIYMELLNPQQVPVAQGKYALHPQGAEGALLIPDTLRTGTHHLRVYTKWMRNFEASEYFHLPLFVVNPHKKQKQKLAEQNGKKNYSASTPASSGELSCSVEKRIYGKREKVKLQIIPVDEVSAELSFCVSIIKKGYLSLDNRFTPYQNREKPEHTGEVLYHPETRGSFITGLVLDSDSIPVASTPVHMTLLGPFTDYFEAVTGPSGQVEVPIPAQEDQVELLITPGHGNEEVLDLVLQDEFSKDFAPLPATFSNSFIPADTLIEEMALFRELSKPFRTGSVIDSNTEVKESGYSFYGSPEFRYYTRDYIEIPNLEEFIYELIPQVQLEKQNRQRYFSVIDDAGPITEYAPLVLVDFVPVTSVESILSLAPDRIEYIDVINGMYIRGSNNYGGIISIVSKNRDLAGLQLPAGSSLFTFQAVHPSAEDRIPLFNPLVLSKRIPDLRTTLYWSAQIHGLKESSEKNIEFFTSDVAGTFLAVIRGINREGDLVQASCEFEVK